MNHSDKTNEKEKKKKKKKKGKIKKHLCLVITLMLMYLQAAKSMSSCTRIAPEIIKPKPKPGKM
jgi:hypothetical protein